MALAQPKKDYPFNFCVNVPYGLIACCHPSKKPTLNLAVMAAIVKRLPKQVLPLQPPPTDDGK